MIRRKPINNLEDCYFCTTLTIKGISFNNQKHIQYSSIDSAMRPKLKLMYFQCHKCLQTSLSVDEECLPSHIHKSETEMDYIPPHKYLKSHMIMQVEMNGMI